MRFVRYSVVLFTFLTVQVLHAAPIYEHYALILNDPPVSEFSQSHKNAPQAVTENHRQRILAAQNSLRSELARRNLNVTSSVDTVLNAVFVRTTPDRLAELAALPGVKGVVRMRRMMPKLDRAAVLINAQGAWNALGGDKNAGLGMKIAIIDSGIDQNHPAFQDNSLAIPAGFPRCGVPADCAFTNHKVIVARSYVQPASPVDPATSRPDDYSPRDHVGHGTGVAMAAAGQRNTGPADTIEGIAPKAYLGSYKVFGSPGVNDGAFDSQIISAIEDAVKDGMNVAVLSLGGPALSGPLDVGPACGLTGTTPCDPEAIAIENATKSGLLVVAAGGNEGSTGTQLPTLSTVDSPGHAPSAIAVGATTNSHTWVSGVRVSGSGIPSAIQKIEGQFGDGPQIFSPVTAPLRDVAAVSSDAFACNALPAGSLVSDFALVERGNCNFVVKVTNAQNAGAAGVIFWDPNADTTDAPSGLANTSIPAILIGVTGGSALKSFIDGHPGFPVIIDPYVMPVDATPNTVADFSSRGPSFIGSIKPDVAAVGTDLYLAAESYDPNGVLYSPDGYTVSNGTSFSTPIVAGAAALVKQKHPGFGPLDVKSAIVNTASQQVTDESGAARVTAVGGGLLDAGAALSTNVTVNPATVSFGILKSSSALPAVQRLQITNGGSATVTLALSISQRDPDSNAHVALDKTSLTLTPGQSDFVTATLSGSLPAAGEYDGAILIQGGGNTLRVPYLYMRGDAAAFNIFALLGDNNDCAVNQVVSDGAVAFKVVDRFGVPVAGLPVQFAASGGGSISQADAKTDANGIAGAIATCGSKPGDVQFTGTAGGLTVTFSGTTRLLPVIAPNGAVNAASFQVGGGAVPGSYISLFGTGLSDFTDNAASLPLPLSIDSASVSFDVPSANLSLPGRLIYVSPSQINVQVPWELQGQASAQIKVTIQDTQGTVYTLPLTAASPAFFEYTERATQRLLLAALDSANHVISTTHPTHSGQVVQLYANGLGPVDNQPATGEPAPASPLARTLTQPEVTIAGQSATVQFSGLAPGFPGLYQVNVEIPAGVPSGVQPVVIKINGATSPAANLPVQ
ncbi:MAG TPA: S8 family serine peptidase [Bryobacteraceae bacterium]|nr:S8 family serine peptidase [Bryobacteraceae bacterium]